MKSSSGSSWDSISAKFVTASKHAANAAVQVSRAVASEVVHGVVGAQCLLNYHLGQQEASCGRVWAIYSAVSKKDGGARVSAWVLDKRSLAGSNQRASTQRLDALIELCKKEVQQLARLKHPGVPRLVSPIEETRTQLVFLTEPIFASLDDILHGGGHLPPETEKQLRTVKLSELEIKHGLLQVADTLHFLHNNAGIAHRSISPGAILITQSGAWKLAGFKFAASLEAHAETGRDEFDYSNLDPSILGLALQPLMGYTAPELISSRLAGPGPLLPSVDVFSLALVAYEALSRQQLLPGSCSVAEYERQVQNLTSAPLSGVDGNLVPTLRQMLACSPASRPPVASFSGSSYFVGDLHVRALKFLDAALQKDVTQRAAFLKELPAMMSYFDERILLLKILPVLLQELRTPELQAAALPLTLGILERQSAEDFQAVTLPALQPLLEGAAGDTLLRLTKNAPLFFKVGGGKGPAMHVVSKLLVRALGPAGDARCHEEALRQVASLAQKLSYESFKGEILPAVREVCLATTSAAVRVASFQAMAAAASRMDEKEAEAMLVTATTCLSVDKTAPTAMCVLGLGDALSKKWGAKLTAEKILPTLTPLLVSPSLSAQQFSTTAKTMHDMVGLIEKTRGGGSASATSSPSFSKPSTSNQAEWMDSVPVPLAQEQQQQHTTRATAPSNSPRPPPSRTSVQPKAASIPAATVSINDPARGLWKSNGTQKQHQQQPPKSTKPSSAAAAGVAKLGAMRLDSSPKSLAANEDPFNWLGSNEIPKPVQLPGAIQKSTDPFAGVKMGSHSVSSQPAPLAAPQDPFDELALQHAGKSKMPPSLI